MSGLLAAIHLWNRIHGVQAALSDVSVCGALSQYIATPNKHFQPMNANYGILRTGFERVRDKKEKKRLLGERALEEIARFKQQIAE